MIRSIISVVVGLVVAIATFMIVETTNSSLHPLPPDLDFKDSIAVKTFYDSQAISFWLPVLGGWIVGSFLCGLTIKIISKNENKKLPIIGGFVLTLSGIANFFLLPHPTWFIVVGLLIFIPSTLFGHSRYNII